MERGYIVERARLRGGRRGEPIYWVTKGSASPNKAEAGLFTREEFDALHYHESLTFVPVDDGLAGPSDTESQKGRGET